MKRHRRIRRRHLRLIRTLAIAVMLVVLVTNPGLVLNAGRSAGGWLVQLVLPVASDTPGERAGATRDGERSDSGRQLHRRATRPFATVDGLALRLPAQRPRVVAYHEAAFSEALALKPRGRCARNVNRYKFDCPRTTPGPRYVVMSSRGRRHPATSAVDVAMSKRAPVVSPITGRVFRVRPYWLYGRYRDYRISMIPRGRPDVAVVMIHMRRLTVRAGDRLVGGTTVIGYPRNLPFHSQVNSYVGRGVSHIHLEVKRIGRKGS
ncbi:MAG: M23 family metallopeptidase [Actinomycetota bacterium]|nr:M23 family metallopeptidase [Actinomycetota bacterium]